MSFGSKVFGSDSGASNPFAAFASSDKAGSIFGKRDQTDSDDGPPNKQLNPNASEFIPAFGNSVKDSNPFMTLKTENQDSTSSSGFRGEYYNIYIKNMR
jgi:hypothetical protein